MKRLLVALAAVAAFVPQPAAQAGRTSEYAGDCRYMPIQGGLLSGAYEGVAYGAFVLYADDPGRNPVSATVRCEIRVNGWAVTRAELHGTTVVPVAGHVSFNATDYDTVELCAVVDYDDDTPTAVDCLSPDPIPIPPEVVWDAVDRVIVDVVDPVACQVLRALPEVPGVEINEEGDVYVDGEPYWDCPPYDIWPPY